MPQNDKNVLETCGLPIFFKVDNAEEIGIRAPENRKGLAVRTWVRSLSVMQKEALVISGTTGLGWRFASDEGPYLNSFDSAPCPLAFFTTGMVSSYMNEIQALAAIQNLKIKNIRLVQDSYYTMEGSLPRGTMIGGGRYQLTSIFRLKQMLMTARSKSWCTMPFMRLRSTDSCVSH